MATDNSLITISTDTNTAQNFLKLLAGAINGNDTVESAKPIEWDRVLRLAEYHNVYSIVFEQAAKCSDFADSSYYNKYMMKATAQIAHQANRTVAFLELYRSFFENGIYPIVMKGIVCRQLYGKLCDHRPSGDEDILIKKSDYHAAKSILEGCGYTTDNKDLTSEQLDVLQEVSFYSSITKLHIELHVNPMGNDNDLRRQMNDYFTDVFDSSIYIDINGTKICTMCHTKHFLYLILHAFRHFTSGGLGIRQVLDILLYEKKYSNAIDFEYLKNTLKKCSAFTFFSDLVHIGNMYLGFRLTPPCEPNCPEVLIDDIIQSGVFGNATQSQRTALQMTNAAVSNNTNSGKFKIALRTVFPSKSQMMNHHPELQQKPWLLPLRWVQRIGRFLKHNKNNNGNLTKESIQISKKRIELLKEYKII